MKTIRGLRRIIPLFVLLITTLTLNAQSETQTIAPQVFLRALQFSGGTRYTAAILKTPENAALRNLSVEITLPASAQLVEMIVPRQVQFDVIRRNRAGQLTLIWQISRVDSAAPLDPYSFTLAAPLTEELEFYAAWLDEDGTQRVENFLEVPPPPIGATSDTGSIDLIDSRFALVEDMGVQVAPLDTDPLRIDLRLLSNDFNPPPQYGEFWWCSLLEVIGVPDGKSVQVIVPLRRPLAPFSTLGMFKQQADGSWLPVDDVAVVTADGQFALYTHTGGVIATGTDAEDQPELITTENLVIVDDLNAPELPPFPTDIPLTDGTGNTIILGEVTFTPIPQPTIAPLTDGTGNTIILGEVTFTPIPQPTIAPITDGTGNTIIFGEVTFTPSPLPDSIAPTVTETVTATSEFTATDSFTATATFPPVTETFTATSEFTATDSFTATNTPSPLPDSIAPTATETFTATSEFTATNTFEPLFATNTPELIATNTVVIAPTATNTSVSPTLTATLFVPPTRVSEIAFGSGVSFVEVFVQNGEILQCQIGGVNCAPINRRAGAGLR